jgi:hypothetical protein
MSTAIRENYGRVFFTGLVVCLILAVIVYLIG